MLGTALMLLECSGVGAVIEVDAVPRLATVEAQRWLLSAFPSYGFLLAAPPAHVEEIRRRFKARGLACEAIGRCDDTRRLRLRQGGSEQLAWNLAEQPLLGCGPH